MLDQDLGEGALEPRAGMPASFPVPRTTFVGRARELQVVANLLDRSRVVTISGPGGAGKTRLALEMARRRQERYPDGVWVVELAPLASSALVPGAVATRLGVPPHSGRHPLDAIRDALEECHGLLILDNCERVLEGAAELADVLTLGCRGLTVLATSRQPLRISGETVLTLPPLQLAAEAVYLFADRAAAALPGFAISDRNRAAVTEICRRLDALPLAIELAAPLVAMMPPAQLADELDHRFEILAGGPRDAGERQRSLRASVEWSHELLSDEERRLFRRLGVFEQAFSLQAVREVAMAGGQAAVALRLLSRLIEKSMVVSNPESEDAQRYRLLETLREFALEGLQAAGEEEHLRRLHLQYFLDLAESASSRHLDSGSVEPLQLLAGAADELRAALFWSAAAEPRLHLRLAAAVYPYWRAFALSEGLGWLLGALEAAPEPTPERARALLSAGTLAGYSHDVELAGRLLEDGLALAAELGDKTTEAWTKLELGTSAWLRLDFERSRALLEASLATMTELGSAFGQERSALHLGTTLVWLGHLDEGRALLSEASALAATLEDAWGLAFGAEMLGWAELSAGRPAAAEPHLRAAASGEILGPIRAGAIEGLAQVAAAGGDRKRALRQLGISEQVLACFDGKCARPIAIRSEALRRKLAAAVGPAAATALLDEGRRFTLREGLTYAIEGRLPEPTRATALTAREMEVGGLVADGLTSREIAARLHLSVRTVESHIDHALNKLGLSSRTQLAIWIRDAAKQ